MLFSKSSILIEYVVPNNRLSNPILSGKLLESMALKVNANPQKNDQNSEECTWPVQTLKETLMRKSSGRVIKSTTNKNFEDSIMPFCFEFQSSLLVISVIGAHL